MEEVRIEVAALWTGYVLKDAAEDAVKNHTQLMDELPAAFERTAERIREGYRLWPDDHAEDEIAEAEIKACERELARLFYMPAPVEPASGIERASRSLDDMSMSAELHYRSMMLGG